MRHNIRVSGMTKRKTPATVESAARFLTAESVHLSPPARTLSLATTLSHLESLKSRLKQDSLASPCFDS
jgi:hypothetical protein